MKAKPGKIIKICALSLSLLLVGGIAVSPITKTYAQESADSEVKQNKRRIVIHYPKRNSGFKVWVWTENEKSKKIQELKWVDLKDNDEGEESSTATIDLTYGNDEIKLGYIVAAEGWGDRDIKKESLPEGVDNDNRYVDLDVNDTNEVFLKAGKFLNVRKEYNPAIRHPEIKIADLIKNKKLPTKPIKVWKGAPIEWTNAIDESAKETIKDVDLKEALKNIKSVDGPSKKYDNATQKDGENVTVKVTFNDDSSVEVDTKLYVSDLITAENNDNTPADVTKIDLKLGEGVWVEIKKDKDKVEKIEGNKDPVPYRTYKARLGIDLDKTILYDNDTLVNLAKGSVKTKEGFTLKLKSENGTDFVVSEDNKVFTAVAVEKPKEKPNTPANPKQPEKEKQADTPSVKPSSSKSLDYKIVPEKKTEKKVKPSEKVRKSYKNLRISREKNVVAVKAAKLLLEIAPERVKDVKTNLINLIAKSESLVKNADTILEKLEAKYEF